MGLIYCFTNKINGKKYVGLTTQSLEARTKKHLSQVNDNSYFHRGIKKHGIDNFQSVILEDNIPDEQLKEREVYWIKKQKSYIDNGGYNLTRGGDLPPKGTQKLPSEEIKQIKMLLKDSSLSENEIAKKFNISIYAISDINRGKSWYDENIKYPIRHYDIKEINYETFLEIIQLLSCHLFSSEFISRQLSINNSMISNINTGKYKKFSYPENIITFPIQSYKIVTTNKIISNTDILHLYKDRLTTAMTKQQLANKYNTSFSYVKSLLGNKTKNHCFDNIQFPFNDSNKELNLQKIEEKLDILKIYN